MLCCQAESAEFTAQTRLSTRAGVWAGNVAGLGLVPNPGSAGLTENRQGRDDSVHFQHVKVVEGAVNLLLEWAWEELRLWLDLWAHFKDCRADAPGFI